MYNNKNNKNNKNNNKSNIELYIYTHTQRIRGADRTLVKCWADVVDGGPTLNQHRANAPCPQDKNYITLYVMYTYLTIRDITF